MYPTVGHFEPNPLHAYPNVHGGGASSSGNAAAGSSGGAAGGPPPPRPSPLRANGPPPPPPSAFPTLQVTIDPRFQVAPPVRAPSQPPGAGGPSQLGAAAPPPPPGHPAPGGRGEPLDLGLERRLVQELESSSSNGGGGNGGASSRPQALDDPYEVLLGRYTEMGYSRQEVAMALAVVGPERRDDADGIVNACRKFKKLTSMGFRPDQVAGALIMHDGDVEAATNTCLDAAS